MAKPIQIATPTDKEFIETAGGGGSGVNIGDPVGGGTDKAVLFINAGNLGQDPGSFDYDTAGLLTIAKNQNTNTWIDVSNTDIGASANAYYAATSSSGNISFGRTNPNYNVIPNWQDAGFINTFQAPNGLKIRADLGGIGFNTDGGTTTDNFTMGVNGAFGINKTDPIELVDAEKDHDDDSVIRVSNSDPGTNVRAFFRALQANGNLMFGVGGTGYTGIPAWQNAGFFNTSTGLTGGLKFRVVTGGIGFNIDGGASDHFVMTDAGQLGIGITSPTTLVHAKDDQNGNVTCRIENYHTGALANASYRCVSDGNSVLIRANSSTASAVRFGATLAGWAEFTSQDGAVAQNGLILGTRENVPVRIGTNNTARIEVLGNGRVGIGTTAPGHRLHVVDDGSVNIGRFAGGQSNTAIVVANEAASGTNNISRLDLNGQDTTAEQVMGRIDAIFTNNSSPLGSRLRFYIWNNGTFTSYMQIRDGNVGINNNSPTYRLDVSGDCRIQDGATGISPDSQAATLVVEGSANNGISLLSPNAVPSNIYFGSNESNHEARIRWISINNTLEVGAQVTGSVNIIASGTTAIRIHSDRRVTIGSTASVASTVLNCDSTTGALLVPRMTTTQRNALTATNGHIVYNTTTNQFNFYENGAWVTK